MGRRFLACMVACLVVASLAGCGGPRPHVLSYKTTTPLKVCSIGVIPLINRSEYEQGDRVLYRVLLSQLVNKNTWRMALEGDVRRIYRELRMRVWVQPTPEQLQVIASRLGVDVLVGGEILEMKEQVEGERVNPNVKVLLKVYSGKDGTLLWATHHSRQGSDYRKLMHFGLSNTVSELGKKMMKEVLELWEEEGLLICSD